MKKKAVIIIVSVLLAVLIAGGSVAGALLPHPIRYDINSVENIGSALEVVSKTEDCVTVRCTKAQDLKILCFTDTHFDGKNKTSDVTMKNIVNNITEQKPDLVLFGGDNVTSGFNKKRANQLAQLFENFGIYWAGVLGNHEGDNKYSVTRPEMISIFSSYDHCLMLEGPDDIWGDGNYSLNILNISNDLIYSFIFMDTGDEVSEETKIEYGIPMDESPYDGVKPSQVEWYKQVINRTKEEYGDFTSTIITHIPIFQMKDAAENAEYLYGEKREGVCSSGFDCGLFDAIKECGSTKSMFFGHDHLNDFGFICDGILLSYLQPSGYGSYSMQSKYDAPEKDWVQGCTLFKISADGSFTQSRFRNSSDVPVVTDIKAF